MKMNTFVIVIIVAIASLAVIMLLIAGCKGTSSTRTPNSQRTTLDQTTLTTQSATPSITTTVPATTPTTPSPPNTQTTVTDPITSPKPIPNIIIDHTNWDWYNSQTQAVFDKVAQLKVFFAHASVGANILDGLSTLNSSDPAKYPLKQKSSKGTPPAATNEGNIYQYDRGNPLWSVKIDDFATYIKNGWNNPKVDIVMNKFCFIDQNADWTVYRDSMTSLETQYPTTKMIFWTMTLTTNSDSSEVQRSEFNQNLRNWISTQNGKILFDIADIEAWSPNGQQQTFISQGQVYQKLFGDYSSDGGHLNEKGMARMAIGLYSLFGKMTTN